jgi:hypothetical protein
MSEEASGRTFVDEVDRDLLMKLIKRTLHIDLTKPEVRQRAWRRIRTFHEIASECEKDGNKVMAEMLRRMCVKAFEPGNLIQLAILAGQEQSEEGAPEDAPSPS